jgi:ATP-dependent Lon protease
MDSILLDRIHRVQFKHLSIDEKIIITNKYILPEYAKKMGYKNFNDLVDINDDVIKYIIDTYTAEAGVRKLKEIIFEILSEINLELLNENDLVLPVELSEDLVKTKYLKKRYPITPKLIHDKPASGIINGLWANALGKGGIIQIETQLVLNANMLDMRLTGMQGDVMKESMSVARSLAWKLTSDKTKKALLKKFKDTKTQGIHIHCPEGAVPKDGPSAGTAITTCIYSLLNNIPIKNDLAITGEMNLQGNVTAIGGLDLKILGGITAGVKTFLFPKENQRDFDDFYKEWGDKDLVKGIEFYPIQTIEEALSHALVDKY